MNETNYHTAIETRYYDLENKAATARKDALLLISNASHYFHARKEAAQKMLSAPDQSTKEAYLDYVDACNKKIIEILGL